MARWILPACALLLLLVLFLNRRSEAPEPASAPPTSPPAAVPSPSAAAAPSPAPGTLIVQVDGASPGDAVVAFALFADARGFEAASPSRKARLGPGETTWTLDGLPRGTYAVKAYVDRDGNGQLNRGAFGAPSEPYGFSNDARGAFGPPSFEQAAFTFEGTNASIRFRVR